MTDKELTDFIEHGENGFVDFALTFGDGWAIHAIEIAKELRARLAQPEKTDVQIGIAYEEANPPEPYCKRCGKKLGTEAYDVHTCTPKQPEPEELARLEQAMIEALKPIPKKEWVGLTDDDFAIWKEPAIGILRWVEATLKERNT